MSGRSPQALLGPSILAILALLASAGAASGVSSAGAATPSVAANSPTPLTTSLTQSSQTWVNLAMGQLDETANRFWQLFVQIPGQAGWKLATPGGVADNGGLVVAPDGETSLLVGFEPSSNLKFSPVTVTANGGQSWSTGVIESGLAAVPDALATATTGGMLALVQKGTSRSILASDGDLSSWHTLSTGRDLARSSAGRACGITQVAAVSFTPSGAPVAAAACSRRHTAGLFEYEDGVWQLASVPLDAGVSMTVVRLAAAPGSLSALLRLSSGSANSYVVARTTSGTSWTVSGPLDESSNARLSSTGAITGGGFVLTLTQGAQTHAAFLAPGAEQWSPLPDPPSGAATVSVSASGAASAFVVDRSQLEVYALDASGRPSWVRSQTIHVPIQYGSSG